MYRYLLVFILSTAVVISSQAQQKRFVFSKSKMGSPFTIICYHEDSLIAQQVSDNAFLLVDSFVNIFSNYIDSSELNRLSASAGSGSFVKLSPAMYDILIQSKKAYKLSHKSFDITIGPLTDLWRSARRIKTFPSVEQVRKTRELVGSRYLTIRRRSSSARLKKPGMRLDLGGIAQGYIGKKVLSYIQAAGMRSVLVDVSGDIATGEAPPGRKGWVLGVNLPQQERQLQEKKLLVSNLSVSTSGDVYQYFEHEGKRYSHIVDPRTGYGLTEGRNVTVIAKDAVTADWLATACSVLPLKKAKRLADKKKAAVMVAYLVNGKLTIETSKRFNDYWQ